MTDNHQEPPPPQPSAASSAFKWLVRANLLLSTALQAVAVRATVRPSLVTFLLGLAASEWTHLMALAQAINLYLINRAFPELLDGEGEYMCKLLFAVNAYLFSRHIQSVKDLLGSKQDFALALKAGGGIAPSKHTPAPGQWWHVMLLAMVPFSVVPRVLQGGSAVQTRSLRYADLQRVDPALAARWNDTSPGVRRVLYVRAGRDTVPNWMSLDVMTTTTDAAAVRRRPVLLYIHGGGWTVGSKRFALHSTLQRVAATGAVLVVSINYRLSPEVAMPEHVFDCKRALVFVKAHCHEWGGDASQVFVAGESAGGHLAALLACTANLRELQPPELTNGGAADTSVAGCIPLYGVLDLCDEAGHMAALHPSPLPGIITSTAFLERVVVQRTMLEDMSVFELCSPLHHVERKTRRAAAEAEELLPPFMVVHGTRDAVAAYDGSRAFYGALQRYRAATTTVVADVFAPVRGGHHAFGYLPSPRALALGDAIVDFIMHHHHTRDVALPSQQQQHIID